MKLIIAGGRDFNNYILLNLKLNEFVEGRKLTEVICGEARGADLLGKQWALNHGFLFKSFPADWNTYGKRAGYIRNIEMLQYATDAVFFFNGESKGTKHCINEAQKRNTPIHIIKYTNMSIEELKVKYQILKDQGLSDDLIDSHFNSLGLSSQLNEIKQVSNKFNKDKSISMLDTSVGINLDTHKQLTLDL